MVDFRTRDADLKSYWTSFTMDPHQIERYDPDPDTHQRYKLDLDPYQFADDKLKCIWTMSLF